MPFGFDSAQAAVVLLIAVAVGVAILALALPFMGSPAQEARLKNVVTGRKPARAISATPASRLIDGPKDSRRRQIQDSLRQIEDREKQRKRRVTLRTLILRAGLDLTPQKFWMISALVAVVLALAPLIFGLPIYISFLGGVAGLLGVPRWFLSALAKRRQQQFLEDLADAVDVMVRGLKAGLPISDAMRVIASEAGPPVGPEFLEVVEGQRLGITIEDGLERMFERMPLPEVSFLSIVISIQSKSGGNLSEALGNLSKVLRERKRMKAKIRAVSQEAKTSATIIGAMPFVLILALTFLNPDYLTPLFNSSIGQIIIAGSLLWMLTGIIVMRQMIRFDI